MVVNCCVVNTAIVVAVADALVERQLEQELSHVQFWSCTWARSLFHCMGFVRRAGTTRKVEIPATNIFARNNQ